MLPSWREIQGSLKTLCGLGKSLCNGETCIRAMTLNPARQTATKKPEEFTAEPAEFGKNVEPKSSAYFAVVRKILRALPEPQGERYGLY
jgi:hypothetical protein